jgi:hypothetical protein
MERVGFGKIQEVKILGPENFAKRLTVWLTFRSGNYFSIWNRSLSHPRHLVLGLPCCCLHHHNASHARVLTIDIPLVKCHTTPQILKPSFTQNRDMEIESIAVICLITLVVLIIQIIVTLRLLLYFHHRSHEKDEEHGLRTMMNRSRAVSIQEDIQSSSHNDAEELTVPGPAYPASSRYSVETGPNDSSSRYEANAPSSWHGAADTSQRKETQISHRDAELEYGNLFVDDAVRNAKKKDILAEVWSKKP